MLVVVRFSGTSSWSEGEAEGGSKGSLLICGVGMFRGFGLTMLYNLRRSLLSLISLGGRGSVAFKVFRGRGQDVLGAFTSHINHSFCCGSLAF